MSFEIKLTYTPIDTDDWEFEFPCPTCRLTTTITFGMVRHEDYFICRGCHQTIKAIDWLGGAQELQRIMQRFGPTFGGIT